MSSVKLQATDFPGMYRWNPYCTVESAADGPTPSQRELSPLTSQRSAISGGEDTNSQSDSQSSQREICGLLPVSTVRGVRQSKRLTEAPRSSAALQHVIVLIRSVPNRVKRAYLTEHPDQLALLLDGLIRDPVLLRSTFRIQHGSVVNAALDVAHQLNEVRGQILIEAIICDPKAVEYLVRPHTGRFALTTVYGLASAAGQQQLRNVMRLHLAELSNDGQASYPLRDAILQYPAHKDTLFIQAVSKMFECPEKFLELCLGAHSIFVALAWSATVPPSHAKDIAKSWLQHPRAEANCYRLAMSKLGSQAMSNLLRPLLDTPDAPLLQAVPHFVKGARHATPVAALCNCETI